MIIQDKGHVKVKYKIEINIFGFLVLEIKNIHIKNFFILYTIKKKKNF